MHRLSVILAGVLGVIAFAGLVVVGAVAAAVLVPIAIVAVLVVRHRLRARVAEMRCGTWSRQPADFEGVVIDVTVEEPVDGRPAPRLGPAR